MDFCIGRMSTDRIRHCSYHYRLWDEYMSRPLPLFCCVRSISWRRHPDNNKVMMICGNGWIPVMAMHREIIVDNTYISISLILRNIIFIVNIFGVIVGQEGTGPPLLDPLAFFIGKVTRDQDNLEWWCWRWYWWGWQQSILSTLSIPTAVKSQWIIFSRTEVLAKDKESYHYKKFKGASACVWYMYCLYVIKTKHGQNIKWKNRLWAEFNN